MLAELSGMYTDRRITKVGLRALLVLLASSLVAAQSAGPAASRSPSSQSVTVLDVHDGDTLTVSQGGKELTVRVEGIDAPELAQPFGEASGDGLRALVSGRLLRITTFDVDKYGRTLARLYLPDGRDVSQVMVSTGLAWHFARYSNDHRLVDLQETARRSRVGLWASADAVPPWDFRSGDAAVPVSGPLHGNRKSHALHSSLCPDYNCAQCSITFQSVEEAVDAGFRPHSTCLPVAAKAARKHIP
jgi:endonuclease YncB( thermonuclease family)